VNWMTVLEFLCDRTTVIMFWYTIFISVMVCYDKQIRITLLGKWTLRFGRKSAKKTIYTVNGETYAHGRCVTVGREGSEVDYICDGVNDDIEINEAIDSVFHRGGGLVVLTPGIYNIESPIVSQVNVNVIGQNNDVRITMKGKMMPKKTEEWLIRWRKK